MFSCSNRAVTSVPVRPHAPPGAPRKAAAPALPPRRLLVRTAILCLGLSCAHGLAPRFTAGAVASAQAADGAAAASADGSGLGDQAQRTALARSLFQRGIELSEAERWEEAADHFARAHALRPASGIAFNWATALAALGRLVEARELASRVRDDADADAGLRAMAAAMVDDIAPQLGRVVVNVQGGGPTVAYYRDGQALPAAAVGVEIPSDPGAHRLTAVRDGATVVDQSYEVRAGEVTPVDVVVPAAAADTSILDGDGDSAEDGSATAAEDGGSIWTRWWLWAGFGLLATGIALVAIGFSDLGPPAPIQGNSNPTVLIWE